jgi:hypothetical protein
MKSNIKLLHVEYVPKEIDAATLYVSERFQVAVHLCACGCGEKVVTPLGPTEWLFTEKEGEPNLSPSIGNWQIPCRSHYWIRNGEIQWSYQWTDAEIKQGREKEQERREAYFDRKAKTSRKPLLRKFIEWFLSKS